MMCDKLRKGEWDNEKKENIKNEIFPIDKEQKAPTILFAENKYCPEVQVTDWWYYREGFPKDFDAFHPPGDLNRSSYIRLGSSVEGKYHWVSETTQSLAEGRGDPALERYKKEINPRPMLNMSNFQHALKKRKDVTPEECNLPQLSRDLLEVRFSTTNQRDYRWVWTIPKKNKVCHPRHPDKPCKLFENSEIIPCEKPPEPEE